MNWNSTEFIWLDWLVLAVGVMAIVWAVYRAIKKDQEKMKGADSQDYLFGKGEPWYIIGAAIFAANIGSEHLVGLAGTGAKDGVGMAHWEMQGWMILFLGWLFVPFYQLLNNKMGKIITMPDFLKFRYTQRTGTWLSIITLIAYVLTKVSVTAFTGGIFFVKLFNLFSKKKINPLIGATGLSAVPMASRVCNEIATKYDPKNHVLNYCMSSNISGVIGSAVAAGVLISFLG